MQLFEYIKSKLTSWDLDKFHLIVHLRPTSPFRKYSHLLTGLEAVYHVNQSHPYDPYNPLIYALEKCLRKIVAFYNLLIQALMFN